MSDHAETTRYVVLISGRGSNLRAILNADLGAHCAGVVSSRESAPGLAIAAEFGVRARALPAAGRSREEYDRVLAKLIEEFDADWIVLAGFMRILSDDFLRKFAGRVVNVHPSLLPKYPGLHPHRQALADGATESGATIHFVTPGAVDGGPIIARASVPVRDDDDETTLAARVLEAEHVLYPATLRELFGATD